MKYVSVGIGGGGEENSHDLNRSGRETRKTFAVSD